MTRPRVLFADEPTGNLDTARSHEIMSLLRDFNQQQGITVVMVTHEAEMEAYASRSIHFKDGKISSDRRLDSNAHNAAPMGQASNGGGLD